MKNRKIKKEKMIRLCEKLKINFDLTFSIFSNYSYYWILKNKEAFSILEIDEYGKSYRHFLIPISKQLPKDPNNLFSYFSSDERFSQSHLDFRIKLLKILEFKGNLETIAYNLTDEYEESLYNEETSSLFGLECLYPHLDKILIYLERHGFSKNNRLILDLKKNSTNELLFNPITSPLYQTDCLVLFKNCTIEDFLKIKEAIVDTRSCFFFHFKELSEKDRKFLKIKTNGFFQIDPP